MKGLRGLVFGIVGFVAIEGIPASFASQLPDFPYRSAIQDFVCPDGNFMGRNPALGQGGQYPYLFNCLAIGIRPGAMIFSGGPENLGCTMNFIFTDGTDLYFGTAGHCAVQPGGAMGVYGEGVVGTSVFRVYSGSPDDVDPLDFALVRINPALHDRVNPAVPFWGGPIGVADGSSSSLLGATVRIYGNGLGFYATPQTKIRTGVMEEWRFNVVTYDLLTMPGDSGAPILTGDGQALASHRGARPPIPAGPLGGPTVLDWGFQIGRGIELAQAALGVHLELVTAPLQEVSNDGPL